MRDPLLYGNCIWWRLTGKRLRARLRLALLLGQTPHAYALWLARHESLPPAAEPDHPPRILALIMDGQGVQETLASLASEAIAARVITAEADFDHGYAAEAEWIMPLISGDIISNGAGAQYRAAAAAAPKHADVIYADDDLVDGKGSRFKPHFKPDWNSELFKHFDYLTGAVMVKTDRVHPMAIGAPDWPTRLVNCAIQECEHQGGTVIHLRYILHHRLSRPEPRLPLKPATVERTESMLPRVTVLVPTRNRVDLLANCLDGLSRTVYPTAVEVLVIDNDSDDAATLDYLDRLDPAFARVLRVDGPFNFSALNNSAASEASGELLCFLNNDIEILDPCWLIAMARQAVRADVGAVGAQLLYPDGHIQHAGVTLGIGGAAAHAHRLLDPNEEGYFHRHALPQFVSAVTAACMVLERKKFEAAGRFDANRFAVSFNDVDLCLRLGALGWGSLYEPRAQLMHHESVSRGFDRDEVGAARQARETAHLQKLWGTQLATTEAMRHGPAPDRFHHPALSQLSEQFVPSL